MTNVFVQDPDARLDYKWDWSQWLATGETIISNVVTVPDGLTLDEQSDADTSIIAWFTGGVNGMTYKITCHIVTSDGREDERSIYISFRNR